MPTFGEWDYSLDRDATVAAYRAAVEGGSISCGCAGCRNFLLARATVFPPKFLELLDQLGVDPLKDGEVYQNARLSPGRHDYGGWFHFVGKLNKTGDFTPIRFTENFSVWMCEPSAPRLASLEKHQVVQLEFHCDSVPWLLDETELS